MAKHDKEVRMMGRDWLNLSSRQRSLWVERAVRYWRGRGFPYVELSHDEAEREILSLLRCVPQKMFTRDSLRVSTVGLRLANYYHPQMWHVPVHDYKAPFESFQDDACLRECIRNSFRSFPDSNSVNARCLRATLKSYRRTTRVSNFRPTVARALCDRYSDAGGKVLDFSAGYGGRLLGCVSLPRNYIGIDPCTAQVTGLRAMAKLLKHKLPGTATIIQGCAEDEMLNFHRNSFDFVVSSPPFFNHERYAEEPTQSYIRYPSYEQWRKHFLEAVLRECHRVLKPGRILALSATNPPGIPVMADILEMHKPWFRLQRVIKMPIYRLPFQCNRAARAFKSASILILAKS